MYDTDNFLDAELRYRTDRVRQDWAPYADADRGQRWAAVRRWVDEKTR